MHPIFQWLDYTLPGLRRASAALVDERIIGGFRNRFVAGVNVLNGTIDTKQYVNTGGAKGAPMSALAQKPQNFSAYAENSFYVLPELSRSSPARNTCSRCATSAVDFSLNGDQPGRSAFEPVEPEGRPPVGRRSDMAGVRQHLAQCRGAELRRERRAELPAARPAAAFRVRHQGADRDHLRDRHARHAGPTTRGTWRSITPTFSNELHVLLQLVRQLQRHQCGQDDASGHRGWASARRCVKAMCVAWPRSGPHLAQPRLHAATISATTTIRCSATTSCRARRRTTSARELLYKHPSGFSIGPNIEWVPQAYYVDSANTLTTEPYMLWGFKAAYDDQKNFSAYIEGRNLLDKAYISSASIIDRATDVSRLFNPGTGRGVFAGRPRQDVISAGRRARRGVRYSAASRWNSRSPPSTAPSAVRLASLARRELRASPCSVFSQRCGSRIN